MLNPALSLYGELTQSGTAVPYTMVIAGKPELISRSSSKYLCQWRRTANYSASHYLDVSLRRFTSSVIFSAHSYQVPLGIGYAPLHIVSLLRIFHAYSATRLSHRACSLCRQQIPCWARVIGIDTLTRLPYHHPVMDYFRHKAWTE